MLKWESDILHSQMRPNYTSFIPTVWEVFVSNFHFRYHILWYDILWQNKVINPIRSQCTIHTRTQKATSQTARDLEIRSLSQLIGNENGQMHNSYVKMHVLANINLTQSVMTYVTVNCWEKIGCVSIGSVH